MDSTVTQDVAEQSEPVAEKRPVENGDSEIRPTKKPRIGDGNAGGLKRVAEIVLVLSAMAKIRGGKKPTELEVELMAEARAKLVELCEGLAPKDVVTRDSIGAVIENLGLNDKARDQKLGFRGPRLTIAERFSQVKKKMEESRKYVAQSSPYTHPIQTSLNSAVETRGTSPTVRMIPSDKQNHPPTSSGVNSASLPLGHVPTSTPPSILYQLPTNDVKPSAVSSAFPTGGNLGRDSSSSILPRVERAQIKADGGPNAPSYASQGQVSSSSNHQPVNAPTWSVQTQATKSGPEQIKPPNQTSAKVDGTAQTNVSRVTPLALSNQNFRSFITQPASGNLVGMHQPLQPTNYVQPSLSNSHNEIAKLVQKFVQPKLPDHPTWIPPSRDYMNKALTCQICHLTINEVDNALICDACEKGYHTRCTLSSNQRGIPRGEWHCSRCLALSNGKTLPPKYGRVMRSNTPAKIPPSMAGVQSSSEKKVGTLDPKANQQKMIANGSSDLQSSAHTSGMALGSSSNNNLAAGSKSVDSKEIQKNDFSSINKNVEEKPVIGSCANILMKFSEAASGSSLVGLSESSSHLVKNTEPATSRGEPEPSTRKGAPVKFEAPPHNCLPEIVGIKAEPSHDSSVAHQSGHANAAEVASQECQEDLLMVRGPDKLHISENTDYLKHDIKREAQDGAQAHTVGRSATGSGVMQHSGDSVDGSHPIKWVGDATEVDDRKTFYQSCCIDGVTYKLQDHVVFRSSSGKLLPAKLQSMYEDRKTKLRWFCLSRYYFPGDLPENVGHPCTTDSNEVFEADRCVTVTAGYIQGPCKVLPPNKYKEENERQNLSGLEPSHGLRPVFLCRWLYDEFKGSFQPSRDSHVVDQSEQLNSAEAASQECQEDISMVKEPEKSHLSESSESSLKYDIKQEKHLAQANTVESSATGNEAVEHSGGYIDGMCPVEWVDVAIEVDNSKVFYQSCRIDGVIYKLQDHVVYQSSSGKLLPAKVQSMYEENKTRLKWFLLRRYYFPGDLPESVGRPCTTDCNEVFETDRRVTVNAGYVHGHCEVLPPSKFKEETERRNQPGLEPTSGLQPVFLCKWLYDELKRSFQPMSG